MDIKTHQIIEGTPVLHNEKGLGYVVGSVKTIKNETPEISAVINFGTEQTPIIEAHPFNKLRPILREVKDMKHRHFEELINIIYGDLGFKIESITQMADDDDHKVLMQDANAAFLLEIKFENISDVSQCIITNDFSINLYFPKQLANESLRVFNPMIMAFFENNWFDVYDWINKGIALPFSENKALFEKIEQEEELKWEKQKAEAV